MGMGWKHVGVFEEVFKQVEGLKQGHIWKCLQEEEEAATALGRGSIEYNNSLT